MTRHRIDRRGALRVLAAGTAAAIGGHAVLLEPEALDVTERDVPVPGLPPSLRGLRIAHLTDVHLTSLGRLHDRVFAALRARPVELVVLTGDAVDDVRALPVLTELCAGLRGGRVPLLATLGNWEHWGAVPRDRLRAAYERAGARLLGDEALRLDAGLAVIATDDSCSGYADPHVAFHAVPNAEVRLFLTHAPGIFDELPSAATFDLGLAGHTHGGQITALGQAVWVPPGSGRFRAGPYPTSRGPVYVSRGLGTSVVPARLSCRPELPIFRLTAA